MRIITLTAIGLILIVAVATFVGLSPQQVRVPVRPAPAMPLRATITIAPTDDALTFARFGEGTAARTIVVTRYQDGVVTGVDLMPQLKPGEDAIAAYSRLGYEAIAAFVAETKASVSQDAATLAVPVDLRAVHAAVATNCSPSAPMAQI